MAEALPSIPITSTELENFQARARSPGAQFNADPHVLLLGRSEVGKSTLAGALTKGKIRGGAGPGAGTRIGNSPGQWRYIKSETYEEAVFSRGDRSEPKKLWYVHDTVGLDNIDLDLEKMRSEVKKVCEQSEQCTIFLCINWRGRLDVHGTYEAFDVCNSLKKLEEVIFVITQCDLASGDADEIRRLRDQWKQDVKEKLISMGVEEEVANDAVTERIVFSSCDQDTSKIVPNPVDLDWPTSLFNAVKSVMNKFSGRRREILTSFATSLWFALLNDAQRAHSSGEGSVVDMNQPNQNLEEPLHSSGIRHRSQPTQLPSRQPPPGEEISRPTQLPPRRQPPGEGTGRPTQLPPHRQPPGEGTGRPTQLPPRRQPPGEGTGRPTQLPPRRQPPGEGTGRPTQLPTCRQPPGEGTGWLTRLPPRRQPPGEGTGRPTRLPPRRQPPGEEIGRPNRWPSRRQPDFPFADTSSKSVLPYALGGGVLAGVAVGGAAYFTGATALVVTLAGGGAFVTVTAAVLVAAYIWYNYCE